MAGDDGGATADHRQRFIGQFLTELGYICTTSSSSISNTYTCTLC